MKTLKYTIVKNEKQYSEYCNILEKMVFGADPENDDEIELLTLLIEKWDAKHDT